MWGENGRHTLDMLIQLVISIGVLSIVLKLVSGKDGPGFPEIIKKTILASIIAIVAGLLFLSKHIVTVLTIRFILMWVLLSMLLKIPQKKIALACLLHLLLMIGFAQITR